MVAVTGASPGTVVGVVSMLTLVDDPDVVLDEPVPVVVVAPLAVVVVDPLAVVVVARVVVVVGRGVTVNPTVADPFRGVVVHEILNVWAPAAVVAGTV